MINFLLVAHLLGAAIWTGGHLILAFAILPKVLRHQDIDTLMTFETTFEKIGMPALVLQIITGLWMAHKMLPSVASWFSFNNDFSVLITIKLALLTLTLLIALHARFRVIPKLTIAKPSVAAIQQPALAKTLNWFALHIIAITTLSVLFVIVGSLFRTGLS